MKRLLIILCTALFFLGCGTQKLTFTEMVDLSQETAQDEIKTAAFYEAEALHGVRAIRSIYRGSDLWPSMIVDVTSRGKTHVKKMSEPYMECQVIDLPLKMTLEEAETLLNSSQYKGTWTEVVVRSPLGPIRYPALYIFTVENVGWIAVNSINKEVFPLTGSGEKITDPGAKPPVKIQPKPDKCCSESTVYTPEFSVEKGNCSTGIPPVIGSDGSITFNTGQAQSKVKYKNISKITGTVDISGLKDLKFVNATFYMVNGGPGYCDAGDDPNPYCNEIDFLETNGNVLTQSTVHLGTSKSDAKESLVFNYLKSFEDNDCWLKTYVSNPGPGVQDATVIDPSLPFDITIDFAADYSNITMTYSQGNSSIVVYDFKSGTKANDSDKFPATLDGLKESMASGWSIIASYWQGWSPDKNQINGNEWFNYSDPTCSGWSDICTGKYIISNIKVTAEGTL